MKLDVILEPEHLESLYYGNGYTIQEIGNIVGCSLDIIRYRMIEYGIPRRISGPSREIIIEPEILWGLYWGDGYSTHRIANIFGWNHETIRNRMKEYGIPRRTSSECHGITDFIFNDGQKQIFEGCMLGDGGLTWATNNCSFSNTDIHKDYLFWLQKQLGVKDISSVMPMCNSSSDGIIYAYRLVTRVIPSIRDEHQRWYPNGKGTTSNYSYKIIPKDIELTPIKMLFWYLGDGTYIKDGATATFCNSLVFNDWELLSKKMYKVLNVDNGIYINKRSKDKDGIQRGVLRLNRIVTRKFFDMVDSLGFNIPECYQYKFGVNKNDDTY